LNRQKALLGILAVLLLVVAWRYLGGDDEPTAPPMGPIGGTARSHAVDEEGGTAPAPAPALPAGRGGPAPPTKEVKDLHVGQLEQVPGTYTPGRDPWRFYEPPPPPPPTPKPPTAEELERRRREEEERQKRLQEEQARQAYIAAHTPPPFTMSYLGTFGPGRRPFAVFSDGKTIYNVREGDRISGSKFVVSHIGYESVDIGYIDLPEAPPQRVAAGGKPGAPGAPGVPPR
jgi:hypothetical protein